MKALAVHLWGKRAVRWGPGAFEYDEDFIPSGLEIRIGTEP